MVSVQSSWNQLSSLKPSLLEIRGFRKLSAPSLSNWIKIERALSPTLLSVRPPETGTHAQPPSSPRLKTFSCLRPTSTDTFNSYPAHKKSSSSSSFHDGGANPGPRRCTFLVYLLLSSISHKKDISPTQSEIYFMEGLLYYYFYIFKRPYRILLGISQNPIILLFHDYFILF